MPDREASPDTTTEVQDAVCLGCGCLCDDIVVRRAGPALTGLERACTLGSAWFSRHEADADRPSATIDGRPAEPDEALAAAVRLLRSARFPAVTGLDRLSCEASAGAIALAEKLGAAVDPVPDPFSVARLAAVQRIGAVGATLGEVRHRADVLVFWNVDPIATHPRHAERFWDGPHARFLPGGRADRRALLAGPGARGWATAEHADEVLEIRAANQLETLWCLRALAQGIELEEEAVRVATGLELEPLRAWARHLSAARYGAFFYGPSLAPGGSDPAPIEAALRLVRDLNRGRRFVALTLGAPGNPAGAEAALGWQTGFGQAIDFAAGFPRLALGDELARIDLNVAFDPARSDPGPPRILIAPDATAPDHAAAVGLACAAIGIEDGGTVIRCDGVALPLRPSRPARRPGARAIIAALLEGLSRA